MSQVAGSPGSAARALTIPEFWQLAVQSQLMTPPQTQALHQAFVQANGRQPLTAENLVEWLIAQQNLSRFQATVLLARQPGPFVFGDYKLYDRIDSGRLAGVFRAVHVATGHPVLLLFLSGPLAQDPTRLAEAAQQAAISQGVNHPHVLRAYHFADLQQYRFVVFENIYGQSADELLRAQGPLPAAEACRLIRQAALGLMRLEERKLTHGELRTDNLWINHLGTVKLLGFPLSRDPLIGAEPIDLNSAGNPHSRIARLADYLAPEVPRSGGQGDVRSDIYALGCILYELLTGRKPFVDNATLQKVLRHASEAPVPPHVHNPHVPLAVSQLVLYLLAKDPAQRYQKPAHVAEALAPYIDPRGLTTFAEPPTAPGQAYDAWLAQRYPSADPDPSTGEFKFQFKAADFAHAKNTAAAGVNFSGVGFAPDAGRHAAPPGFVAPNGAPAGDQVAIRTEAPVSNGAPTAIVDRSNSAAERRQIEDERFQKQMVTYSIVGGGTLVAMIVGLIVVNKMGSKPEPERPDRPTVAASAQATPAGTSAAPRVTPNPLAPAERTASVERTTPTPPRNTGSGATSPPVASGAASEWDEMYQEKAPLWASPLPGPVQPVKFDHLPIEAQLFVVLRPSEILAHAEGKKVWEGLGGWGKLARATVENRVGVPLEDVEQLIVSFLDNGGDKFPNAAYVARLVRPTTPGDLLAKWGDPVEATYDGKKAYKGNGVVWYLPKSGGGQVVVTGPEDRAEELVSEGGPAFTTQMGSLANHLDARAHCSLLFKPHFFFSGGKTLFSGGLAKFIDSRGLLFAMTRSDGQRPANAGSLALHLGPSYLYSELRMHPGADKPPVQYAKEIHESLLTVPQTVYNYYKPPTSDADAIGFVPTDYSRKVLARYPKMLDAWTAYATSGVDDGAAVVTSVLPTNAAHNLALATQLALRDPGVAVPRAKPTAEVAMTLEQKLKNLKIPLVFGREALGRALEALSKDQGIEIEIMGPDLQLDGITQNQSFGMNLATPVPLEVVLQEIVKQANPGNPEKKLDVPEQKLLYVLSPDKKKIIITTRAKAWERGTPPDVFKVEKPKA